MFQVVIVVMVFFVMKLLVMKLLMMMVMMLARAAFVVVVGVMMCHSDMLFIWLQRYGEWAFRAREIAEYVRSLQLSRM